MPSVVSPTPSWRLNSRTRRREEPAPTAPAAAARPAPAVIRKSRVRTCGRQRLRRGRDGKDVVVEARAVGAGIDEGLGGGAVAVGSGEIAAGERDHEDRVVLLMQVD